MDGSEKVAFDEGTEPPPPFGRWLIENMPDFGEIEVPPVTKSRSVAWSSETTCSPLPRRARRDALIAFTAADVDVLGGLPLQTEYHRPIGAVAAAGRSQRAI